jgi:hypothetical protein
MTVTPGEDLTVSVYLVKSVPYLVQHSRCTDCAEYVSAVGSGNQTGDTTGSPFSGAGTVEGQFTDILTGLDVQTAGIPTVAVLGDGLIDALGASTAVPQQGTRISDDLAAELQQQAGTGSEPAFGVVDEGIEANQVLTDADTGASGTGGPSALSRLASDVLAEPNVGTVIVDEGLEDLLQAGNSSSIESELNNTGYAELESQLTAWGMTTVFGTQTPCSGYPGSGSSPEDACTTGATFTVDYNRTDINASLISQYGNGMTVCPLGPCQLAVDFDGAVTNGGSPEALEAADDSGDHVNLSDAGYAAITATIPTGILTGASPPGY